MASPQLENGYTKISNEILDALARTYLSNYEARILFHLLRKTYGFNKKHDHISAAKFARATGIDRRHVQRTLKRLQKRQFISAQIGAVKATTYQFNKNYEEWKPAPKQAHPTTSAQIGADLAPKQAPITSAQIGAVASLERNLLNKILKKGKNPPGSKEDPDGFSCTKPSKEDYENVKRAIRQKNTNH